MSEKKLKVGDIVWANDRSAGGKILKHEWKGKIIWISQNGMVAKVQELGLHSDRGVFWRSIKDLEKSDREEL